MGSGTFVIVGREGAERAPCAVPDRPSSLGVRGLRRRHHRPSVVVRIFAARRPPSARGPAFVLDPSRRSGLRFRRPVPLRRSALTSSAIGLARVAGLVMPPAAAIKLVITLAVIALPGRWPACCATWGRIAGGRCSAFRSRSGSRSSGASSAGSSPCHCSCWRSRRRCRTRERPTARGRGLVAARGRGAVLRARPHLAAVPGRRRRAVVAAARPRRRALPALLPLLVPLGLAVAWRL